MRVTPFLPLALFAVQTVMPGVRASSMTFPPERPDYRSGSYDLDQKAHRPEPYGRFCVKFSTDGTAHLQNSYWRKPLRYDITADFKDRTSTWFGRKDSDWKQLNVKYAKELWGNPRKGFDFLIFDAVSTDTHEPNIYHLDLKFEKDGAVCAYRIRGIGICNPQWVDKDWSPQLEQKK